MNPANVPSWGCPWHGPVQGGSLTLPNAATMAYPQPPAKTDVIGGVPTGIPDTRGSTYRVAVPGVPAVTPAAEDVAAGREWRNEATLSGGRLQLYGKQLDGWIYVDPAGSRWLVRCAQLNENVLYSTAASLVLTVTLTRFGDLGVAPETHSYPLTITGWGIDVGTVPSTVRLLVDDVRGDGAAAVVMVHQRTFDAGSTQDVRRAHSFLELTIAGPGSAALVAIGIVRTRSQVVQIDTVPPVTQTHLAGWHKLAVSQGGSGQWEWVTYAGDFGEGGNPTQPHETRTDGFFTIEWWDVLRASVWSGTASADCHRIVALWYGSDGSLSEAVLRYVATYNIDWPMPADGIRDATIALTWSASLEVAGVAGATIEGSENNSIHSEFDAGSLEVADVEQTVAFVIDGTSSGSTQSGTGAYGTWEAPGANGLTEFSSQPGLLIDYVYSNGFAPWSVPGSLKLVRYANHVIGQRVTRTNGATAFHPPSTPSGTANGAVYVPSMSPFAGRYGSWCPYTHQTLWGLAAPVCYV